MSDSNQVAKYIAIGCGALILLSCCLCGGLGALGWSVLRGPHEYASAFLADIRKDDYASALQRMDASYQSSHDVAALEAAVRTLPALDQHTDATLTSVNIDPTADRGQVSGTLSTPAGGYPVELVLHQVGDYWYVASVTVAGAPLP